MIWSISNEAKKSRKSIRISTIVELNHFYILSKILLAQGMFLTIFKVKRGKKVYTYINNAF